MILYNGAPKLAGVAFKTLEVFTLDTGKLFPETEAYHWEVEGFFNSTIRRYYPDSEEARELDTDLGKWGMCESLDKRHRCCSVRKVNSLKKARVGKDAWITGLRAARSITRLSPNYCWARRCNVVEQGSLTPSLDALLPVIRLSRV